MGEAATDDARNEHPNSPGPALGDAAPGATASGEPSGDEPVYGSLRRPVGWLYLIGGGIGLLAAISLMLEKLATLTDSSYVPTCNINPIIACGSIMDSSQAEAFGFPNPLVGIAGFAVLVTAGTTLLAGFTAPHWFWLGLQAGATFGVVFVHWLIYESLYEIGALCPYCMVVWVVTIPIFWYTTLHNFETGRLRLPGGGASVAAGMIKYHALVLVLWYLVIVTLILQRFWSFWSSLI